jgi:CheY-like chemotaxis protein
MVVLLAPRMVRAIVAPRNEYAKKVPSARLGAMRTLRILVVDDQEHMRELLVEALSADEHTVEAAENGMAAVRMFDAQPYDLVVSDLQMPQMDGPKLYGELQKRRPQGMPGFVFITGEDEAPEYRTFLQESKLPVVTKPFKLKEFRQLLGTLFSSG